MVVDLTLEADFLQFCSFPLFGIAWLSTLGLFCDLAGVLFVSSDLFRLGSAIRRSTRAEEQLKQHIIAAEILARERKASVVRNASIEKEIYDKTAITGPMLKFNMLVLQQISDNKKIALEAKVQADRTEREVEAVRGAILDFFREGREETSLRLGAAKFGLALILFGFLAQIVGSWPCGKLIQI
ncbi:hypothetical protein [Hoeflea sp.]|uniref:hypothetical protein n=1 Tax=Hoeflea sp. TaxID=1940281 RepID=UPI003BB1765F